MNSVSIMMNSNTQQIATADRILDFILEREGGFINDPKDPGGATNYGISLRFLQTIDPAMADLDEDGDVDADDVFALSPDNARAFYRQFFYQTMGIHQYPAPLGAAMLDTGVNMGKRRAGRILQRALNRCGAAVAMDGIVGPKTRTALMFFDPMDVLRAVLLIRVFVYADLCRKNPDLHRFFYGWVERVRHLESFCMDLEKKRAAA